MGNFMTVTTGAPRIIHHHDSCTVTVDIYYGQRVIDHVTGNANAMVNAAVDCIEQIVQKYGTYNKDRYASLLSLMN